MKQITLDCSNTT